MKVISFKYFFFLLYFEAEAVDVLKQGVGPASNEPPEKLHFKTSGGQ